MDETERSAEAGTSRLDDPRISFWLMIATYVAGGAGVALAFYGQSESAAKAIHYGCPLFVGVAGILSMVRHSVFHNSDAARSGAEGEHFYMIELGLVQGAVGIIALVAFFAGWGVNAEVALTLTYTAYLSMAFVLFLVRSLKKGLDGGRIAALCAWLAMAVLMLYFGIAAAV